MLNRFAEFGWSIELATGWLAEIRQDSCGGETLTFLAIVPESNDALLRLTPDERGIVAAAKWVELSAQINRTKGRIFSDVRCGDFAGNMAEFQAGAEWIRAWALCCGDSALDASYRCKLSDIGRDDRIVDKMLSTLRSFA